MNMLPKAAPIIVISPKSKEAHDIAGWLRGAGLGEISTVRTCDEAIFMLGRSSPDLLIIDEAISPPAEQRLLRHIQAGGDRDGPPLVRLIGALAFDPLALGRSMAAEVIRKPLLAHDVVLRVGAAMQRPDLLGRLDQSSDETARNLDAARQMQIGLLPTENRLQTIREQCGVGVAAFYRSGEAVGGDFWDVRPTVKGRFALALADFTGHGLSAALNTFRLQALLSDKTLPRGQPTRMTALLNERLHLLLPRGLYATMVYLHIDAGRRLVAWCGAGGPPPLLVSVDRADDLENSWTSTGGQIEWDVPSALDAASRGRSPRRVQRRPVRKRRPRSGRSARGDGRLTGRARGSCETRRPRRGRSGSNGPAGGSARSLSPARPL